MISTHTAEFKAGISAKLGKAIAIINTSISNLYFYAGNFKEDPSSEFIRKCGNYLPYNGQISLINTEYDIYVVADVDWSCNFMLQHESCANYGSICDHNWKTVPAFYLGKTYTDCTKCGAKQEEASP